MGSLASGNYIVDQMGVLNISGNVIPQIWYKTITKTTGKPYLLAITLLADIVYWYRPKEVRDEVSGRNGYHMKYDSVQDRELFEELYGVICDVVCVRRKSVKVNGEDYPYELVKSKFLKLDSGHLEYVINSMKGIDSKITNIRAYMVTALYNAPDTINHYYQQMVQHDMYTGELGKKEILSQ